MRFSRSVVFILLSISQGFVAEPVISGLIGGASNGNGYAATLSPSGAVTSIPLNLHNGEILTTAINQVGAGIIGGSSGVAITFQHAYSAFVFSSGTYQEISNLTTGQILSVGINDSNLALIGGYKGGLFTPTPYVAFVTPQTGIPAVLNISKTTGAIRDIALNSSNLGLIGGTIGSNAYAAFVQPGSSTPNVIQVAGDSIVSVALNNMGVGIVGGNDGAAAFVTQNSTESTIISIPSDVDITSVAINNHHTGLIGGTTLTSAYASFVGLNSIPQPITLPAGGAIYSVAINRSDRGLIGGAVNDRAYAAMVSPGAAPLSLADLPSGFINSVALNNFDQGLIGGLNADLESPYTAIVSAFGMVTPLNLGVTNGEIQHGSINAFFTSQLPTLELSSNNFMFATYINVTSPQDVFYFIPSLMDGSFNEALESAAPTRNILTFNTVLQNSFYLTTNLSAHLRNERLRYARKPAPPNLSALKMEEEEFLASCSFPKGEKKDPETARPTHTKPKKFTLWMDAIGAFAYQDAQQQTVSFNPSTGGATLGFDAKLPHNLSVGGGASYFYTYIHEKNHQGHSSIQQEDLFLYGSWQPNDFYVDLGVWGGLFQTKQTRNIHMTGFNFTSTSKPDGGQLVPHLELGWLAYAYRSQKSEITWNLLGMVDWANGWQDKYQEKGSSPFNFQQKSHHGSLLRTEAGLRFSETLFFKTWSLICQEKGSYVNIQSFHAGKMQAFLVGAPSSSLTLQTLTNAQNLGLVQLSITAAPYQFGLPASMLMYQGEFGSGYQSHQLNLEFAWNF